MTLAALAEESLSLYLKLTVSVLEFRSTKSEESKLSSAWTVVNSATQGGPPMAVFSAASIEAHDHIHGGRHKALSKI